MSDYKTPPTKAPMFPLPDIRDIRPFGSPSLPKPWNAAKIEPLDWLLAVMRDNSAPAYLRIECAKIAAPYRHRGYRPVRTEEQLRLAQERLRQMAKPK